jgi:hypothetical protein
MVVGRSSQPPARDEPCAASKISLARLSNVARCDIEKLVAEVEEEEVDGNVPA